MSTYRPYLLPLLPETGSSSSKEILSPMEEETQARNLPRSAWPGWDDLARDIRLRYGIPYLTELPRHWQLEKRGSAGVSQGREPAHVVLRYILLKADSCRQFVIEHPDGIVLHDQIGQADQMVILARPTIFAQLWLHGETETDDGLRRSQQQSDDDSQAMLNLISDKIETFHPTDWHLDARENHYQSRVRVDGRLLSDTRYSLEKGKWLINSLIRACHLEEAHLIRELEGSTKLESKAGSIDLRISVVPSLHGGSLVVRFLYPQMHTSSNLSRLGYGMDQIRLLESAFRKGEGLWIVAGPTGAGKSTTLHAILQWSVRDNEKILTVEDPVERTVEGIQQVSIGTPPGMTYPLALRAFLRQAPDSILIGEIRDAETASLSIQAARTGHRVLTSLHAGKPEGILHRFADLGQPARELEPVIRILAVQRLVPLTCPQCRRLIPFPRLPAGELWAKLTPPPTDLAVASGCAACHDGFTGQTAVAWCASQLPKPGDRDPFLVPAWRLLHRNQITLETFFALVSPEIRALFPLCQRSGFC